MGGLAFHTQENRGETFPTSREKRSTFANERSRLQPVKANIWELVPVDGDEILQGVDYVRAACDLIEMVTPRTPSIHYRMITVAAVTGINDSALQRMWDREVSSIKTSQMVTLLRLATANGYDVFTVRGVREIHDHIFGVRT